MPSKILVEQIAHTNDTSAIDIDSSGNMVLQKELKFNATAAIKNSAGNAILQESGGNVTLSNVRLPASGGISDSSGNAILTESGGVTSIGANVNFGSIANDSISGDKINGGTISNAALASTTTFPAGHVIQVVYAQTTTATSITSTTQGNGTSTGLSATITPVSSSNKFFISYVGSFLLATHPNPAMSIEIYDGSSVVATENGTWGLYVNGDGNEADNTYKYPFQTYITPSGSGAITYTMRAWKSGNAVTAQHNSRLSTLTIMEIQQ